MRLLEFGTFTAILNDNGDTDYVGEIIQVEYTYGVHNLSKMRPIPQVTYLHMGYRKRGCLKMLIFHQVLISIPSDSWTILWDLNLMNLLRFL